jgi:hypothetical protein
MYLPPEYQLKLIRQRQRELHLRAERARQLRGVRPVRVHVRLRAAWHAFQAPGLTEGRAATQR